MEPQNSVIFGFQLFPIDHQICRRSWNLVIMTLKGFSPHAVYIFWGKLSQNPETRLSILLYIAFLPKYFVIVPAISSWLNTLDIWDERVSIWVDSLYEVRWQKGHSTLKPASVISIWSLSFVPYPNSREIIRDVKQTLTRFSCIFNIKFIILSRRWNFTDKNYRQYGTSWNTSYLRQIVKLHLLFSFTHF